MSTLEKLENVSVQLKANVYFDGGVVSHTILLKDGSKKTAGLIRAGQYHFTTDAPERMDIVAGSCRIKLANEKDWKTFSTGQFFRISGKSSFDIAVDNGIAEYLCSYES
jgi:uncharacterized protein YaiE (UPF0345 family)